jgi:hypothetical protein
LAPQMWRSSRRLSGEAALARWHQMASDGRLWRDSPFAPISVVVYYQSLTVELDADRWI